ncbi:MAG: sulfotransferase, partial [Planctomycetes bacterium]|nr:sulfotransferase [Planctomycetota bacterium]
MMARPEVIRKGRVPTTFWKRVQKKYGRTWNEYALARRKERFRRKEGVPSESRVAFVFGCQRSGTNMTLRVLARSMDVDYVEESDARAFVKCRIVDTATCCALVDRSTARCVIFKPICDSHRALELYGQYANSRGIWIYRDYRDVANSAVEYWGDQSLSYMRDLFEGGGDWGFAQWNREGVSEECLSVMREAAGSQLTVHEAAALFWYMRNRTFFEQQLDQNPRTLLTRYEDVVTEPAREFERMCTFLDLRYSSEMVSGVFSHSLRKRSFPDSNERVTKLCDDMLARLNAVRAGSGEPLPASTCRQHQ